MCCKNNGKWYIEPETIENTIWLAKQICQKYSIPLNRVVRHYDCTHKNCPEPFVREPKQWQDFLSRLEDKPMNENEAITFLTERGIITTPDYWSNALNYYKNVNYLLIKTAEYIKELENKNS